MVWVELLISRDHPTTIYPQVFNRRPDSHGLKWPLMVGPGQEGRKSSDPGDEVIVQIVIVLGR